MIAPSLGLQISRHKKLKYILKKHNSNFVSNLKYMELQIHTLAVLHDAFQSETYSENVGK